MLKSPTSSARSDGDDVSPQEDDVRALVDLVRRAQWKDTAAYAELIRQYERIVLSIAYAALSNSDRAGDIAQDAFVRAWERLAELKEPARFGPWLCGITRNLAIDARRRLRLAPKSQADLSPGTILEPSADGRFAADPLDELQARERRELVASALAELDETSRPVLMLRYYEGLSSKEIGQLLQLAPAAVDMRLSRARHQLREKLSSMSAFVEQV